MVIKPSTAGPPQPNVHAERVSLLAADSNYTEVVYTRWRPSLIWGMGGDGSSTARWYICGEDGSGTMKYGSVGSLDGNDVGGSASTATVVNASGAGWSFTITFYDNKYAITFTKQGAGLTLTFEFVAIKAKNIDYQTDSKISADSSPATETYSGLGFDPDIIFAVGEYANEGWSVGFGTTATVSGMSTCRLDDDSWNHPGRLWLCSIGSSPYNGWRGDMNSLGSGQYQVDWTKVGSGATVSVMLWALEFDDLALGNYSGVPVNLTNIISSAGFTPEVSCRVGRWNGGATCLGLCTDNGMIGTWQFKWKGYANYTALCGKQGGSTSSKRYDVDHTLSSGTVQEGVNLVGSPSGSSSPGQSAFALGPAGE